MPLTLITGPANSAKAREVLGAFAAHRRRGALLVVPTAADALAYQRELADGLGGKILTFAGLGEEIARRVGFEGRRVSPLQRERLLKRALKRLELTALAQAAGTPGFRAAALELISELERSLISPERFARAAGGEVASGVGGAAGGEVASGVGGAAGGEVAAIYTAYIGELKRAGRLDAELYTWRALDALRAEPGRWGSTPVFFYGFDDLTPLERDAIETLSRIAGAELTVSLTYEAGRAALAARAEAVQELRPLADRVVELPALDTHYADPALHFLERHLFEGRVAPIDPGGAVRLLEAGGERAEVELVAAEVLELLRAGVPGEEIAVIFRSGPDALVERVFAEYGIAVSLERELPFPHTPLGRGLLALARCALQSDAPAAELIAYLRTPGVYGPADEAEAIVLREGLRTAREARERLGLKLRELDALDLAHQARRLLTLPRRGEAALLTADEELDARAAGVLLRALSELEELGERPSGGELIELLETLRVRAVARGAVRVAGPLELRAQRFRAVFVCGLQEGSFPAQGAPEPFLPDDRRRSLAAAGLCLRPREDALARERYLFYSCVSRATERVVVSFRSSDEEGNVELASPFVEDLAELFVPEWRERRRRRLLADVCWSADQAPTERERARAEVVAARGATARRWTDVSFRPAEEGGAADGPGGAVGGLGRVGRLSGAVGGLGRVGRLSEAVGGLGRVGRLSEATLARMRHEAILSAGALESYADCPIRWLVEKELRPRPLAGDPEPMVRGKYMHELLERLLRELGRPLTPATLPEAHRILDRLLAQPASQLARGRPEAVRAAALRSIEADLRRYLEHEAAHGCGWSVRGLEVKFGFGEEGEEGSLPALELSDEVRVRGVLDRVDDDGAGHAVVRDYKSGGVRPGYAGARWSADRRLQVALYMLAARDLMGLQPVAGLYQPLGGDDLRARGVFLEGAALGTGVVEKDARTPEGLAATLEDARERAVAIAARLRAGELKPCPQTCSPDGCRYPGICRSG